jgi:hypothetical protein
MVSYARSSIKITDSDAKASREFWNPSAPRDYRVIPRSAVCRDFTTDEDLHALELAKPTRSLYFAIIIFSEGGDPARLKGNKGTFMPDKKRRKMRASGGATVREQQEASIVVFFAKALVIVSLAPVSVDIRDAKLETVEDNKQRAT